LRVNHNVSHEADMKTRRILLLVVCGLCLAGCKSGKQNQELLERELRYQEERIYELEDALDQCESELEYSRRDSQSPGDKRAGGGGGRTGSSNLPIIDLPSDSGPSRPSRRNEPEPVMPTVEPGEEFTPPAAGSGASAQPEPRDRHIARIVLNKQMTGGASQLSGGEDGIVVVFEPRNARGEMVAEPGSVSIALVDPERSGPQARLARWDFAANDAFAQFHRSGKSGRGYEFELPWPEAAPPNKKLQLFVRYVAPDGRKLMSEMTINVDPTGTRQAQRWRTASPSSDRDRPLDAGAQGGPLRRLLSRTTSGQTAPDTEAPRFSGPDETAGSPSLESDDDAQQEASDDRPVARNRRPVATARKPADDDRPTWTPYR
jgi:hypothetical protein